MLFRFTGDGGRVFPASGLVVEPGDVVDLDANPDPHFFEAVEDDEPIVSVAAPEAADPEQES